MPSCDYCGEPVEDDSWDYFGDSNQKVFLCNKTKCHLEMARDARAEVREREERAREDDYHRYH